MSGRKAIPGCWSQNDSSSLGLFSCCLTLAITGDKIAAKRRFWHPMHGERYVCLVDNE